MGPELLGERIPLIDPDVLLTVVEDGEPLAAWDVGKVGNTDLDDEAAARS